MIRPWFRQEWCLLIVAAASSWVDEFIQRYETQGLGLWEELDSDWVRRTQEYGIRRPTQDGWIFVYRAFDLWSHTGPFYRATVVVHQVMLPDEILWRIALHWPDLGHDWNRVGWHLVTVDDSRSSSCLPDLISPTYVLVMHGLLGDMAHRPHGLLEITSGDACHVRATVLPSRINLPILQELLHAICRQGWPMVRCVGTHNRVALTDELQLCSHGFFVQITVTGVVPAHALDISRWSQHAGRLVHLDFQSYTGDFHLFEVGVAHGLTLLASSVAQCWGDQITWHDWLLGEMRTRYLSLCGMEVQLVEVHVSAYELDASFDSGRTYMVAVPSVPPPGAGEANKVLFVRVRVDGYFEDGAIWSPTRITCPGIVEQLGLLVICTQHDECKCYHNGEALLRLPVDATNGDFVVIYKSDRRPGRENGGWAAVTSGLRSGYAASASSQCSSEPGSVVGDSLPSGHQ